MLVARRDASGPTRGLRAGWATSWAVSGLLLLAIAAALWGFLPVIEGIGWWFGAVALAASVLLAAAIARTVTPRPWVPPLAATAMAIAGLTLTFAASTAFVGIIPTPQTFDAFAALQAAGVRDIAEQATPADPTEGIRYLVSLGVVVVAVLVDLLALAVRVPALAGIPLFVLFVVPGMVQTAFVDPGIFVLTAALWLGAMLVSARPPSPRVAVGAGAAALIGALIVPLALPSVAPPTPDQNGSSGVATGLNPIVTLGDDLRRGNPTLALTYISDDDSGQYLRMTVLDDFTGPSWEPRSIPEPGNDVGALGAIPGLDAGVTTTTVTVDVSIANVLSRWLPVPYAARSIDGLDGEWSWEPDGLTVRTERSNAREQTYTVVAEQPTPSVEQLIASASVPVTGMERYLALPEELPATVAETADDVAGDRPSPYEQALALQSFFRSGDFTYSEQAPVDDGYDGSGAEVLGAFLEARSGYCVHFSSAMAAMARTLGIPARVVVGFTPGSSVNTEDGRQYRVTTHNLHAWPELHFEGIGWVRFEPTPGRGVPPSFAPLDRDDPSTPDVDESVPPPPEEETPEPSATPTAAPDLPDEETDGPTDSASGGAGAVAGVPWGVWLGLGVLALLLAPAVVRVVRRTLRLGAADAGSALAAWDEVRDLADDFGYGSDVALTPRQLADGLAARVDDRGAAALHRLRTAMETEAFARDARPPAARDLRVVLWSLRRAAGPVRAAGAFLLPRSLIRPWLPAPVTED